MFKIALCDDDASFLDFLQNLLLIEFSAHNCNIHIEKFISGKKLIESVEKNMEIYDIIFLDINMPEISGLSIADKLRQLDDKFILIFTTNMENDAPRGYRYNAFRFILKRTLRSDIQEAISTILYKSTCLNDETIELKYKHKDTYNLMTVKKKISFTLK